MSSITLPFSGREAIVRGMTGVEEDLFGDEDKQQDGKSFNNLLRNCTEQLDGKIPTYNDIVALTTPDRIALMLDVRRETYGPLIASVVQCGNKSCNKHFEVNLTLDAVTRYPTTRDAFNEKGEYELVLSNGDRLTYTVLNGTKELMLMRAQDTAKSELLTMTLLVPLVLVETAGGDAYDVNSPKRKKYLQALPARLRDEIRDGIEAHAFGYDTRFEAPCPKCGVVHRSVMERLQPGFFFPQKSATGDSTTAN